MADEMVKESVILTATVGEVTADVGEIVKIDSHRLDRIKAADPSEHPAKFVTVEVESGWSNNKRHWPSKVIDSIAEQVRSSEPVGYKGHPLLRKDFDKGSDYPDPQTLWLSAISTLSEKGKRLLVKGYNITDQIRRELASGATRTVSICGDATMRVVKGGYEVEEFSLDSIDWARPGSAGMAGRVVALTAEMEDDDEGSEIVKPEDIANLTEGDLRRHNPDLVTQIEGVGEQRKEKDMEQKVGEQEAAVEAAKPDVDAVAEIRKLLNLDEKANVFEAVGEVLAKAKAGLKAEYEKTVDKLLDKVENEDVRALVKQLVGEMDASTVENEEDATKQAEEKVAEILDTNPTVKKIIGEMVEEEEEGKTKRRVVSPSHRPEERGREKEKKDTDNIAYETVSA